MRLKSGAAGGLPNTQKLNRLSVPHPVPDDISWAIVALYVCNIGQTDIAVPLTIPNSFKGTADVSVETR